MGLMTSYTQGIRDFCDSENTDECVLSEKQKSIPKF